MLEKATEVIGRFIDAAAQTRKFAGAIPRQILRNAP
jgi:hypothetical protein